MAFNARLCVVPKGDDSIVIPNDVRPCVQSKGDYNMPCPTSFDCVCSPRAIMCFLDKDHDGMPRLTFSNHICCQTVLMAYHAEVVPLCAVQGQRWHVTPDVIRPHVLPNSDDGIARTISYHHVCAPKAKMSSHA
uniref:Uncharacterized protein n=1 Tax=Solanum lycopersicum TaxID=4081 RepID=K4DGJ6_SOLLC